VAGLGGDEMAGWRTVGAHGGVVVAKQLEVELGADDDMMSVVCVANGTQTATSLPLQLRVLCRFAL